MWQSAPFLQDLGGRFDVIPAITPVNLATAANPGDRINVMEYNKIVAFIHKGVGTDNDDPVISLIQADAATSGNTKALNITDYYTRLGADITAVGVWTKATQASAATLTIADSAQAAGMIAIEIDLTAMDIANGYKYLELDIADVGSNAQIGGAFYVLAEKRFEGTPTNSLV